MSFRYPAPGAEFVRVAWAEDTVDPAVPVDASAPNGRRATRALPRQPSSFITTSSDGVLGTDNGPRRVMSIPDTLPAPSSAHGISLPAPLYFPHGHPANGPGQQFVSIHGPYPAQYIAPPFQPVCAAWSFVAVPMYVAPGIDWDGRPILLWRNAPSMPLPPGHAPADRQPEERPVDHSPNIAPQRPRDEAPQTWSMQTVPEEADTHPVAPMWGMQPIPEEDVQHPAARPPWGNHTAPEEEYLALNSPVIEAIIAYEESTALREQVPVVGSDADFTPHAAATPPIAPSSSSRPGVANPATRKASHGGPSSTARGTTGRGVQPPPSFKDLASGLDGNAAMASVRRWLEIQASSPPEATTSTMTGTAAALTRAASEPL